MLRPPVTSRGPPTPERNRDERALLTYCTSNGSTHVRQVPQHEGTDVSIKWMTAIWDDATEVSGTELMVLLVIADHAGDDNAEAWPSVARLAQRTRRSERSVQEALASLEQAGWLTRTMRPGHSTLYTIHYPEGGAVH